ncbi:MAG: M14 family zinc carboxypeptidase [Gammaproteobacteria bacterium]
MKLLVQSLFIVLGAMAVSATLAQSNDWPKNAERVVIRAHYDDPQLLRRYFSDSAPWQVEPAKQFVIVDVDRDEYAEMIAAGFRVSIDTARTRKYQQPRHVDARQGSGIPGFSCYSTVPETLSTAAQLALDFPNLATWTDIGDSWEKTSGFGGDDLMVLRLTNQSITGEKPKLFITSAIHAREYTTAELTTRFAQYLLAHYDVTADVTWLLDHHEIHLMLQANPDGRRQAETGLLWRKNTNQNYCAAASIDRGADLNRNYDFQWGCCGGSSDDECSAIYRGPGPASEPEITAVQAYLRSLYPDRRGPGLTDLAPDDTQGVFLDIHSAGGFVTWPWGFDFAAAPNASALQTMGRRLAYFNDYRPLAAFNLFFPDGNSVDFGYGELGVASFAYELGSEFFENCEAFENTILPDNLESLMYAAKSARAPYVLASGPRTLDAELSSVAIFEQQPVTVTAVIDDTVFQNSEGNEPVQNITDAQLFIDTPPWAAGATALPMTAADGAFDSPTETVTLDLNTSDVALGRHTLFIQGRDASSTFGVVSARFLYVLNEQTAPRIVGRIVAADTGIPLTGTVSTGVFSTVTNANGDYELLLAAGTVDLTITPDDASYGAQTVSGVVATPGQFTAQSFTLFPFCALFADDAETASVPWVADAPWGRTTDQANSGAFSWTDSPSGDYANDVNVSLTSPAVSLAAVDAVQLEFANRCRTETNFDYCIVETSLDGGPWLEMARYTGSDTSFSPIVLPVAMAPDSAAVQVRFRLQSDNMVTRDGWFVDDIVVRGTGAACVTTTDSDGDGVSNLIDNCIVDPNPTQLDTNADGFGNACDADLNNDGIVNIVDLGLFRDAFFDTGVLDSDFNGDGVTNIIDLGIIRERFFLAPGPSALASP